MALRHSCKGRSYKPTGAKSSVNRSRFCINLRYLLASAERQRKMSLVPSKCWGVDHRPVPQESLKHFSGIGYAKTWLQCWFGRGANLLQFHLNFFSTVQTSFYFPDHLGFPVRAGKAPALTCSSSSAKQTDLFSGLWSIYDASDFSWDSLTVLVGSGPVLNPATSQGFEVGTGPAASSSRSTHGTKPPSAAGRLHRGSNGMLIWQKADISSNMINGDLNKRA